MYLRTCSNSKPTVDTAYPRAQKCSPVKFRSLPHKRAIAMALFPFRNPITEATGYFGGIAMHMCTWSGSRCPSLIHFRHNILLFLALTKPRGMLCPNGTVKPFLVSLVEPVAYLKSELASCLLDTITSSPNHDKVVQNTLVPHEREVHE